MYQADALEIPTLCSADEIWNYLSILRWDPVRKLFCAFSVCGFVFHASYCVSGLSVLPVIASYEQHSPIYASVGWNSSKATQTEMGGIWGSCLWAVWNHQSLCVISLTFMQSVVR